MSNDPKDRWDKFQSISTVLSTLVLGAVGFYYTVTVKDVQDRADKNAQHQLDVQSESWREAEAAREQEWKEQQDRFEESDKLRNTALKNIETQNSEMQTLLQTTSFLADKDDQTKQALLVASSQFNDKRMTEAVRVMVGLKRAGNAAVAEVDAASSPASESAATTKLSNIVSASDSLAAQASFYTPDALKGLGFMPGIASVYIPAQATSSSLPLYPGTSGASGIGMGRSDGTGIYSPPTTEMNTFLQGSVSQFPSGLSTVIGTPQSGFSLPALNSTILGTGNHYGMSSFEQEFAVSQKIDNQVVRIVSGSGSHLREGTGFYINSAGILLTVSSALDASSSEVTLIASKGVSYPARVIWRDSAPAGLALLDSDKESVPLSQASEPNLTSAFVVGRVSKIGAIATRVTVSNLTSDLFDVYGLTLLGFRGSPIVNSEGEVFGILLDDHDTGAYSKGKPVTIASVMKNIAH